jgi:hypothetical protein
MLYDIVRNTARDPELNDPRSDGDDAQLLPPATSRRYDGAIVFQQPHRTKRTRQLLYDSSSASTIPKLRSRSVSSTRPPRFSPTPAVPTTPNALTNSSAASAPSNPAPETHAA